LKYRFFRRLQFIGSSEDAETLVQPLLGESVFPEFIGITEQRAPFAALIVLIMTAALVALQIGYDVYFLVFEDKNVLAN
jgi:hypothetical protein